MEDFNIGFSPPILTGLLNIVNSVSTTGAVYGFNEILSGEKDIAPSISPKKMSPEKV